jgi:hypothetical protein
MVEGEYQEKLKLIRGDLNVVMKFMSYRESSLTAWDNPDRERVGAYSNRIKADI